jgi:2-polyprenyl-3-methyl-5-hydroxy-6-metoxy-1,4-benzoquinol methylase
MALDQARLQQFIGKLIGDMGAAFTAPLIVLGDRLGLFRALAMGEATPDELAERTGLDPRYVREWLAAQAAAGNVTFRENTGDGAKDGDAKDGGTFGMSEEQIRAFADESSPFFMPGAYEVARAMFLDLDTVEDAFRTGAGVGWHEHHACLFRGAERFFKPGYGAHLVKEWLPALGVLPKLSEGARVADVGCGCGSSTAIMAEAFPHSTFVGFDYHLPSLERARQVAREAGIAERVRFEQATAQDYPGAGYDLVTFFDCLHDMGDPVGAARHVRESLGPDGVWMIVEPFAHDKMRDNLNPVGRAFYAASTMICTPASRAQEGACCLGAQAGEARISEVAAKGGFTRFRRAAETPFHLVLEARP